MELEAIVIEKPDLTYTKKAVQSVMRTSEFLREFTEGDYSISNPKRLVTKRIYPTKHTARLECKLKGDETKEQADKLLDESRKQYK